MFIEYFTQLQKNIPSSQQPMERSPKTGHIVRHKASLNRYKKIEITT